MLTYSVSVASRKGSTIIAIHDSSIKGFLWFYGTAPSSKKWDVIPASTNWHYSIFFIMEGMCIEEEFPIFAK